MKKYKKLFTVLFLMAFLFCLSSQTAFAFSESDAQAQVDAAGREAVSGNVLVWFLCAIAFLKVSQKIDSFMSEYYPPWEPPVSRFRATRKWYFPPSEPPQHIVAAHIFDFTINLLIVILGELLMQYHQIIYREVFLCLRRQKSEVFWNFWEKI